MANLLPLIHLQIGSVFARFREPRKCGILSVLGNPGGEPRPGPSDPDEEYRASARIRRRRRKHVVNAKIAIHFKRDACKICAVWDIPVICAEQRRKNSRVAVASNGIACAQKEAPAVDPDAPVLLHVGCKVADHPDLASGCDASHGGIC